MLLPISFFKYEQWAEGKCYEDACSLLIPYLNKWGYSTMYTTYNLMNKNGELAVGIKNSLVNLLVPPLQTGFDVLKIETKDIVRNPAAVWPLGEK
jgi:hypothetical protein